MHIWPELIGGGGELDPSMTLIIFVSHFVGQIFQCVWSVRCWFKAMLNWHFNDKNVDLVVAGLVILLLFVP